MSIGRREALVHGKNGTIKAGSMEIRMGRRVVHSPHAHMVFVTERRGKVVNIAHLKRLEEICRDVRPDFEAELRAARVQRRTKSRASACDLSAEGTPFGTRQQPQGRFKPAPQGRVPGNLHLLRT